MRYLLFAAILPAMCADLSLADAARAALSGNPAIASARERAAATARRPRV